MACCKCNRSGRCKGCICVKEGRQCVNCLPGRLGLCRNGDAAPASSPARCCPGSLGQVLPDPQSPSDLPLSNSSPHISGPNAAVPLPPASAPIDALPSLELVLLSRVPTLQHVPKAVRDSWTLLLCEVLSDITTYPSEVGHWCKLFMLPKCVLMNPPRGGRSHWRDTLKLVLARIQKWKGGGIMDLWSEATRNRGSRSKTKTTSPESLRCSNATRARREVADGQYKKALQCLTSMGLASPSSEVFNEMLAKHPQADPPSIVPSATPILCTCLWRTLLRPLNLFQLDLHQAHPVSELIT